MTICLIIAALLFMAWILLILKGGDKNPPDRERRNYENNGF